MEYDLELENVANQIKKENAKLVCIQLPDGLKPKAEEIANYLEEKTGCQVLIWLGSCYGACDLPLEVERMGVELLIQWGHSEWKF
ncbi:diphthamide synthesis protein [Candidatus Woesearchaeota archaeon]|nr:diphthamide synthesis protein [Candidatus Woesearchaeota archaeon]